MSVELLIDEFQIRDRLLIMGRQIEADYRDKPLTIVAVLTGSLIALADLVRQIGIPLRIALLQASSSYRGTTTTATTLVVNEAFAPDVVGRDVLLLDDILDTGQTLNALVPASPGSRCKVSPDSSAPAPRLAVRQYRSNQIIAGLSYLTRLSLAMVWTITTNFGTCLMLVCYTMIRQQAGQHLHDRIDRSGVPIVLGLVLLMKSRLLRLALVTQRYPPLIGGAEKVFSYLAMALSAKGADVTVLTSQPTGLDLVRHGNGFVEPAQKVTHDLEAQATVKVTRLPTSPLHMWGTLVYMGHLAQWFRANTVDLAYVSMLKHDAYAVLGAARRFKFPVVLRPEGAGATGDVAWQSWGNFGRWIGQRCRDADAFVAVSSSYRDRAAERLGTGHNAASSARFLVSSLTGCTTRRHDSQRRTSSRGSLASSYCVAHGTPCGLRWQAGGRKGAT